MEEFELEKKWLLRSLPNPIFIKREWEELKSEAMVQTYLAHNERLRKITTKEYQTFQHFFKNSSGEGSSIENKKTITEEEYLEYLKRGVSVINKIRRTYLNKKDGFIYEFDSFFPKDWNDSIFHFLEVEFQNEFSSLEEVEKYYRLPESVRPYIIMDVTPFKQFSNWALSNKI